jgi:hypothetical protein
MRTPGRQPTQLAFWQTGQAMYRPRSNRNEGDRNDHRRGSTAPARRKAYRRGQRGGRSPALRNRTGFRPSNHPPQSALRLGRSAKQWQPAWEVGDDFPEDIAVLPGELRVIEAYLAALLDECFEQVGSEADKTASETAKCDVDYQ